MSRDVTYLTDIFESAKMIQNYVDNLDEDGLRNDSKSLDAICRRIEIIGEATKRLSKEFRQQHPHIPWQEMAGMRDFLIHDYDEVDVYFVFDTATNSIPALIAQLEPLIPPEAEDDTK